MPDLALALLGTVAIVLVYVDALTTTLAAQAGAGPVTRRLTRVGWRAVLRAQRMAGFRVVTRHAGPVFLLATVLQWVAGLWAGWTLVFMGAGDAIRVAATGEPAGLVDVVHFAGFNIVTLGVGDVEATSPGWRLASTVASFSGLFLLTLAITYLLSVVSAVVSRRALAVQIDSLGSSPSEILGRAWVGDGFSDAALQRVGDLAAPLATTAEQHLAFPVLEQFSAPEPSTSAPVCVARLDEAIRLVETAVDPRFRPHESVVGPVRRTVDRYVEVVLRDAPTQGRSEPPTAMTIRQIDGLRAAGVPVVEAARFAEAIGAHRAARSAMHQHVCSSGWAWSSVVGEDAEGRSG